MFVQSRFLAMTAVPAVIAMQWVASGTAQAGSIESQVRELIGAGPVQDGGRNLQLIAPTAAPQRDHRLSALAANDQSRTPVIAALHRLRTFSTWKRNWDGEGAPAPRVRAIEAATVLLGLLDSKLPQTPKVALNSLGQPMFMLLAGDKEFSATLQGATRISYYLRSGNEEEGGLIKFNQRTLPKRFAAEIATLIGRR